MERLTKTYSDGTHAAADNLPCGENSYTYKGLLLEALGKYEDADEQGLLLRLPCKIGDTIYFKAYEQAIVNTMVTDILIDSTDIVIYDELANRFHINDFGKTVFLTKAEAEQKLKEKENK